MSKKIFEFSYNDTYMLPYDYSALAPYISAETNYRHYTQHFLVYLNNLRQAIETLEQTKGICEFSGESIEYIIEKTYGSVDMRYIYNNASQVHLHILAWESLIPIDPNNNKNILSNGIIQLCEKSEELNNGDLFTECKKKASELFGSGWLFIVLTNKDQIAVRVTKNASNPINMDDVKLILVAIDLWEHAYYLDYTRPIKENGSVRIDYVTALLENIINWKRVHNLLLDYTS